MNKDTLYYDGACPLCRAEIGKLERHCEDRLIVKDIHALDGEDALLDRQRLLSRLHLKTADGEWVVGLDANIRAWQHTPFRHLWRVLGWPLIRPISTRAYEWWLHLRSRKARN